jgi:coenzyme F420-dependent glucose-6-phosphate dehydrogenase
MNLGYQLASEEHGPNVLVENARRAEEAGFAYGVVSDHFHPWIDAQGQSPFVWSVLGGIARETTRLRVGTGVSCPLFRMHPSLVAQAAATPAIMFEGRFFLGAGTGERLNEHILSDAWPSNVRRQAMLEEAIELIRLLWRGGTHTFEGRFFAGGPGPHLQPAARPATDLPGRAGAQGSAAGGPHRRRPGLDQSLCRRPAFDESGGAGKPRHGELLVCCAETRERAIETVMRQWPLPDTVHSGDSAGRPRTLSPETGRTGSEGAVRHEIYRYLFPSRARAALARATLLLAFSASLSAARVGPGATARGKVSENTDRHDSKHP